MLNIAFIYNNHVTLWTCLDAAPYALETLYHTIRLIEDRTCIRFMERDSISFVNRDTEQSVVFTSIGFGYVDEL